MNIRLITFIFLTSPLAWGNFPQNSWHISKDEKDLSGVQQEQAKTIIKQIKQSFGQKFAPKTLQIEFLWDNAEVRASSTYDDNDDPKIVVYGGLARHPLMTEDGLSLILCHELGHFLGGAPKKFRGHSSLRSWSSAEGQADYYAASKCLKKVFRENVKNESIESLLGLVNIPPTEITNVCIDYLCQRILAASLSVSKIYALAASGNPDQVSLKNKDQSVTYETITTHPNPQCRLDTYEAGALCPIPYSQDFDLNDPSVGACDQDYGRPLCWFHPEP